MFYMPNSDFEYNIKESSDIDLNSLFFLILNILTLQRQIYEHFIV